MTVTRPIEGAADLVAGLFGERSVPSPDGMPPSGEELLAVLEAGTAVPDHGFVRPWRFVVVSGEGRERLADALERDVVEADADAPVAVRAKARAKAHAAPTVIVLVASPSDRSSVPRWEQIASTACTGYAMVLAGAALGLGAIWKSTTLRDGVALRAFCGCEEHEELLGWVLIGEKAAERPAKRSSRQPFDSEAHVTFVA